MSNSPPGDLLKEVRADAVADDNAGVCAKIKKPLERPWNHFQTQRVGMWLLPVLAVLCVGALFIIAGPVFGAFKNDAAVWQSSKKNLEYYVSKNNVASSACPYENGKWTETLVYVQVQTQTLQGTSATLKVSVELSATMDLITNTQAETLTLPKNQSLVVFYGTTKYTYTNGQRMGRFEATEFLTHTGDFNSYAFYPLDTYVAQPTVMAYLETKDEDNTTSTDPVGVCIQALNRLSNFDYKRRTKTGGGVYSTDEDDKDNQDAYTYIELPLQFQRTMATKFFSIFIVILMWALSACMLVLTIDHLFLRRREALPPHLSFSIALLFALPAVRNTQPDAPPIGAAVDVLGFFWNESIAALSACMFMAGYVGLYKHKPMTD